MNVQKAAEITRSIKAEVAACKDESADTLEHAMWMLDGIVSGYIQHEKAHRWLGYAQGILVYTGNASLHDVKLANKKSKS